MRKSHACNKNPSRKHFSHAVSKCIRVIHLSFSWKSRHYCHFFQRLCTRNEARKRNFTHKQAIFTHNRIRDTHSKTLYKQYLDLFLPIADIPDINSSPTTCVYGYTVYYRITPASCWDKQNSRLYFSIRQKHLIKHLCTLHSCYHLRKSDHVTAAHKKMWQQNITIHAIWKKLTCKLNFSAVHRSSAHPSLTGSSWRQQNLWETSDFQHY